MSVVSEDETREAKRRRQMGVPPVVTVVFGQSDTVSEPFVPDVAMSTAPPSSESPVAAVVSAATDLPTGAAVAKQLCHFDLARDGATLARGEALLALAALTKWARNKEQCLSFFMYFQRYGGHGRMLDFLKENMADTELVKRICTLFACCMYWDDKSTENHLAAANKHRRQFVDLDGIQTLLLANDEHFAITTISDVNAAVEIWMCLTNVTSLYPNNDAGFIATEKEQTTIVGLAICDWLEKLSASNFAFQVMAPLLSNLCATLDFQLTKSILKSNHFKTRNIIPTALKAVLPTIGKWKGPTLKPETICSFFYRCSKTKDLLTASQFQELLPLYVEALTEYPDDCRISSWTIPFLENASTVVDKQVMKKSGICVALFQFDVSEVADDSWKKRARKLIRELCE